MNYDLWRCPRCTEPLQEVTAYVGWAAGWCPVCEHKFEIKDKGLLPLGPSEDRVRGGEHD